MREAPSLVIIDELTKRGATVAAYDPVSMIETARVLGARDDVKLVARADEALQGADALLIVTEWKEFRTPDFDAIKAKLKAPVVLDGRNLYDPKLMKALGIDYSGIGRG
jgi:UDPglucose 6-dehydrogenase